MDGYLIFVAIPTWNCDVLPICTRSREGAKQGTSRKLLVCRGRKFFRNAHLNISCTLPTAANAVEDINPFDGEWLAEVKSKPRITMVIVCVTICLFVSIYAIGSSIAKSCRWKGCWLDCQLFTYEMDLRQEKRILDNTNASNYVKFILLPTFFYKLKG